jgi:CHAT domain-containing protein/tetratricopeptide (TPR) repeat protein
MTRRQKVFVAGVVLLGLVAHPDAGMVAQAPDESPGARLNREGITAFSARRFDDAERLFIGALAEFERAGSLTGQANALRNLTFLPRLSDAQCLPLLGRALELAVAAGDDGVTGLVRHQLADRLFVQGDLAGAFTHVDAAVALLETQPTRTVALARALTSRGRLFRNIGRNDEAIADQLRSATLSEKEGDSIGASQAHHSRALTLTVMGRKADAVAAFDRAIDFARKSGDPDRLATALAEAGWTRAAVEPLAALALLNEAESLRSAAKFSTTLAHLDGAWVEVLTAAGRLAEALARAAAIVDGSTSKEIQLASTWRLASLQHRTGHMSDGFATAERAMALTEDLWRQMVPSDTARRGFARINYGPMSEYVSQLWRVGRYRDALEAAERTRSRAFLDLLASVDVRLLLGSHEFAPSRTPEAMAVVTAATAAPAIPDRVESLITIRGAVAASTRTPEPDIATVAVAEPPRLATVIAQAARLQSHLLTYWVTSESTLIWVVAPDGTITHEEVPLSAHVLAPLVEATLPPSGGPTRGAVDRLTIEGDADQANRDLYQRLITPVASALPLDGRGLLTIVPHGPLHRLSFAGLRAPSGSYLVEQTALHYSASASALAFTGSRRPDTIKRALVVANPATRADVGTPPLPPLPGAAEEGRIVARALGARSTAVLSGTQATELAVRDAAVEAGVIHLAAHGIIRDDDPFGSFIALGGNGRTPAGDGRLTMGEVYGMRLKAALVVLSGCRTAVGPVSGDGMLGLTRGFFAAGAPSVVASLWDVSDTVTASLFERFYAEWPGRVSKAAALRRAQMQLIRDLRAGRKTVSTPAGTFILPEHPSLWAGLVLVGEP